MLLRCRIPVNWQNHRGIQCVYLQPVIRGMWSRISQCSQTHLLISYYCSKAQLRAYRIHEFIAVAPRKNEKNHICGVTSFWELRKSAVLRAVWRHIVIIWTVVLHTQTVIQMTAYPIFVSLELYMCITLMQPMFPAMHISSQTQLVCVGLENLLNVVGVAAPSIKSGTLADLLFFSTLYNLFLANMFWQSSLSVLAENSG